MNEKEMQDAVKKSKAAAMRKWRHKNPEKVKQANIRYWQRRALRELEQEQTQQNTQEGVENAED